MRAQPGGFVDRLHVVDLTPTDGDLLARFYSDLYVGEFPDPNERESLGNMSAYLTARDETNAYLVTLLLDGDRIVAGCVADYFERSSCGVIEFLVVDPAARSVGVGGALAAHIERRMHDAAYVRGKKLVLVLAEINDPFMRAPRPDNVDPFVRLGFWARRGYHRLAFPYRQPALSEAQAPVENLLLAAKALGAGLHAAVPAALVVAFLRDYLIVAMRIVNPEASPQFVQMATFLEARSAVALEDLGAYIGDDPRRPLDVRAIGNAREDDFAGAMRVYRRAFTDPRLAVSEQAFASLLHARRAGVAYHLWALRASPRGPVAGMASFFALGHAGFGGYVAFEGALRGSGRLRLLLARIERQLAADSRTTCGWYIECESGVAPIFERCGFFRVALPYSQPPLRGTPKCSESFPLVLLYKEFGASYVPPRVSVEAFAASMEDIESEVYGLRPLGGSSLFAPLPDGAAAFARRGGSITFELR